MFMIRSSGLMSIRSLKLKNCFIIMDSNSYCLTDLTLLMMHIPKIQLWLVPSENRSVSNTIDYFRIDFHPYAGGKF